MVVTNGQVDDSGRYECKTRKTTVTQAAYDVQFRNTCKINMNSMVCYIILYNYNVQFRNTCKINMKSMVCLLIN